eukprot:scaffold7394_cov100-Skeletonema_dohrnii-CCMP3373.AAC.2
MLRVRQILAGLCLGQGLLWKLKLSRARMVGETLMLLDLCRIKGGKVSAVYTSLYCLEIIYLRSKKLWYVTVLGKHGRWV